MTFLIALLVGAALSYPRPLTQRDGIDIALAEKPEQLEYG